MSTLFISDLHLAPERPAMVGLFLDFLQGRARSAEALYILGDLFEYWIGDDAGHAPEVQPITAALRTLTQSGVPVYVMHGNRDFLLGAEFEAATGCRLLADPSVIDLHGERVLVMHGDTLCTDDVDYLKFRAMVRNPPWIAGFLAKSIPERLAMVREVREVSKTAMAAKKPEIMDVNTDAVAAAFRAHGVRHLIHGHTHRPAQHRFDLDGQPVQRTVLGDWYDQGSVLSCDAGGCSLETLNQTSS